MNVCNQPAFYCLGIAMSALYNRMGGCVENIDQWYTANRVLFDPPVCNKIMYKGQMTVMFVGGPNSRTDFHLDEGSEFFYQISGDMELPTIQQGKRKLVRIRQGQVFLLPSRVPHSPQRPCQGSLGMVIERKRTKGTELDGLRYYTDFGSCDEILWEKFFYCDDLELDLAPVVEEFKASGEYRTNIPANNIYPDPKPVLEDAAIDVPEPFYLANWLDTNRVFLLEGNTLPLFPHHPDSEFTVNLVGGNNQTSPMRCSDTLDTFILQIEGPGISVLFNDNEHILSQGTCCIIPALSEYSITSPSCSIHLFVQQNPTGNK